MKQFRKNTVLMIHPDLIIVLIKYITRFLYKKLVYKKLGLVPTKMAEILRNSITLCLFKVKNMDIIANISLNLYS